MTIAVGIGCSLLVIGSWLFVMFAVVECVRVCVASACLSMCVYVCVFVCVCVCVCALIVSLVRVHLYGLERSSWSSRCMRWNGAPASSCFSLCAWL